VTTRNPNSEGPVFVPIAYRESFGYNSATMTNARMPGPGFFEAYRMGVAFETDYISPMQKMFTRYGDYVDLRVLGQSIVFLFHPDGVEKVSKSNAKNYGKGDRIGEMEPLLGKGLITSEGSLWLRHRKLIAPEFHQKNVELFYPTICRHLLAMMADWRKVDTVDVVLPLTALTYAIAGECLFGAQLESSAKTVYDAIDEASASAMYRMSHVFKLPLWAPVPLYRRANAAIRRLNQIVFDIIDERSKNDTGQVDILTRLTRVKSEGSALSREEIRDEVMNLLLAGHETTANTLAWTLYLLALHPEIQSDLRDELKAGMSGEVPTIDELMNLGLLRRVIDESMRLYPPISIVEKKSIGADTAGGYELKPGTNVTISQYITHRHPDFWQDPEKFDPRRFEPNVSKGRHLFAYFPFGRGPRECVGQNMALLEAVIILGAFIRNFQFELVPGKAVGLKPLISLRPDPGVFLKIRGLAH
jgi:cytochrome P450